MYRYLIPFLLVVSSVALYFVFISPNFATIEERQIDQETYADALIKKDRLEMKLAELQEKIDSISEEDKAKLGRVLPEAADFDPAGFVNDVSNIALRSGIVIKGAQFGDVKLQGLEGKHHGAYFLEISFEASYEVLKQFLADLEKSEHLLDINKTSIQVVENDKYKITMKMQTYWVK